MHEAQCCFSYKLMIYEFKLKTFDCKRLFLTWLYAKNCSMFMAPTETIVLRNLDFSSNENDDRKFIHLLSKYRVARRCVPCCRAKLFTGKQNVNFAVLQATFTPLLKFLFDLITKL